MSSSRILFYSCLAFLGGIFISFLIRIPFLFISFLVVFIFIAFFLQRKFYFLFIPLLFFSFALLRVNFLEKNLSANYLLQENDKGEKTTLLVRIISEPLKKENQLKMVGQVISVEKENIAGRPEGKILVFSSGGNYQYGDILRVTGFLKEPPVFEDFNYKNYLLKEGIFSLMKYPEIEIISHKRSFLSPIISLKERFRQTIYQNLSPPQSFILSAVLLGDKERLPAKIKDELNRSGIRHIVAVSGMHIVILSSILMVVFLSLGLWRWQAFFLTILFVIFYIVLTGFQISGIRAGIMGGILLLSQVIGRPYAGLRMLVFVAFLMVMINPFLLLYDVGFQLSFLATAGIILLSSHLKRLFKFLPEENFLGLRSIISMSFSAQIFTLPILLYNFGYFSLVSPVTNILVLPFIPPLMFLGFLFLGFSIIFYPLARVISWFSWIILTYIVKTGEAFSRLSFSSISLRVSWVWLPLSYIFLGLFILFLKRREKPYFLS